jgi:hypothetical protein
MSLIKTQFEQVLTHFSNLIFGNGRVCRLYERSLSIESFINYVM